MQSCFRSWSRSSSQSRSAPASPSRHNSASTLASTSTSSFTLSQTHFNSYFGTIPEESDQQLTTQSEGRSGEGHEKATDVSVSNGQEDNCASGAATVQTISNKSRIHLGNRTLRRRSSPLIHSMVKPRLAAEQGSSEDHECSEKYEDALQDGKRYIEGPQVPVSAISSELSEEEKSKLVAEPNPLRSLAESRRLLATSSTHSLSFANHERDDGDDGVDCQSQNNDDVNQKSWARGLEDQQSTSILLKSDLHDKKAVRINTTSSLGLTSPLSSAPSDRPRRTSSAPETPMMKEYCTNSNEIHSADWSQGSLNQIKVKRSSGNLTQKKVRLLSTDKYSEDNDEEANCSYEDEGRVVILYSWKSAVSDNFLETNEQTGWYRQQSVIDASL